MYTPNFDKFIDLQEEKNAIVEYCSAHWSIKNNQQFTLLVDFLFDYGTEMGINRFNSHTLNMKLHELNKAERARLEKNIANGDSSAIELYYQKSDIGFAVDTLYDLHKGETDYSNYMPTLLKFVKTIFSDLKSIKPNDWKKYITDVENYTGHTEGFIEDFKGSASSIGNGYVWETFPEALSLSTLDYKNERDRKPLESLVSTIVLQAYATQIHNNTVSMIQEVKTILNNNVDTFDVEKIIPHIENKTLKALFEISSYNERTHPDQESFEKSVITPLIHPQPIPVQLLSKYLDNTALNSNIKEVTAESKSKIKKTKVF